MATAAVVPMAEAADAQPDDGCKKLPTAQRYAKDHMLQLFQVSKCRAPEGVMDIRAIFIDQCVAPLNSEEMTLEETHIYQTAVNSAAALKSRSRQSGHLSGGRGTGGFYDNIGGGRGRGRGRIHYRDNFMGGDMEPPPLQPGQQPGPPREWHGREQFGVRQEYGSADPHAMSLNTSQWRNARRPPFDQSPSHDGHPPPGRFDWRRPGVAPPPRRPGPGQIPGSMGPPGMPSGSSSARNWRERHDSEGGSISQAQRNLMPAFASGRVGRNSSGGDPEADSYEGESQRFEGLREPPQDQPRVDYGRRYGRNDSYHGSSYGMRARDLPEWIDEDAAPSTEDIPAMGGFDETGNFIAASSVDESAARVQDSLEPDVTEQKQNDSNSNNKNSNNGNNKSQLDVGRLTSIDNAVRRVEANGNEFQHASEEPGVVEVDDDPSIPEHWDDEPSSDDAKESAAPVRQPSPSTGDAFTRLLLMSKQPSATASDDMTTTTTDTASASDTNKSTMASTTPRTAISNSAQPISELYPSGEVTSVRRTAAAAPDTTIVGSAVSGGSRLLGTVVQSDRASYNGLTSASAPGPQECVISPRPVAAQKTESSPRPLLGAAGPTPTAVRQPELGGHSVQHNQAVQISQQSSAPKSNPATAAANTATTAIAATATAADGPKASAIDPPLSADDQWYYIDPNGKVQGPFPNHNMNEWFNEGYFDATLQVRRVKDSSFSPLSAWLTRLNKSPFILQDEPSATVSPLQLLHGQMLRETVAQMGAEQNPQLIPLMQQIHDIACQEADAMPVVKQLGLGADFTLSVSRNCLAVLIQMHAKGHPISSLRDIVQQLLREQLRQIQQHLSANIQNQASAPAMSQGFNSAASKTAIPSTMSATLPQQVTASAAVLSNETSKDDGWQTVPTHSAKVGKKQRQQRNSGGAKGHGVAGPTTSNGGNAMQKPTAANVAPDPAAGERVKYSTDAQQRTHQLPNSLKAFNDEAVVSISGGSNEGADSRSKLSPRSFIHSAEVPASTLTATATAAAGVAQPQTGPTLSLSEIQTMQRAEEQKLAEEQAKLLRLRQQHEQQRREQQEQQRRTAWGSAIVTDEAAGGRRQPNARGTNAQLAGSSIAAAKSLQEIIEEERREQERLKLQHQQAAAAAKANQEAMLPCDTTWAALASTGTQSASAAGGWTTKPSVMRQQGAPAAAAVANPAAVSQTQPTGARMVTSNAQSQPQQHPARQSFFQWSEQQLRRFNPDLDEVDVLINYMISVESHELDAVIENYCGKSDEVKLFVQQFVRKRATLPPSTATGSNSTGGSVVAAATNASSSSSRKANSAGGAGSKRSAAGGGGGGGKGRGSNR